MLYPQSDIIMLFQDDAGTKDAILLHGKSKLRTFIAFINIMYVYDCVFVASDSHQLSSLIFHIHLVLWTMGGDLFHHPLSIKRAL